MSHDSLRRSVLKYLSSASNDTQGFQSFATIIERMSLPDEWWEADLGGLEQMDLEDAVRSILEELTAQGLVEVGSGARPSSFRLREGRGPSSELVHVKGQVPPEEATAERPKPSGGDGPGMLVPLDHNSPDYLAIKDGLSSLYDRVREDNQVGSSTSDRSRILNGLSAAMQLWSSSELQLIQIKVGVLMAVEDAYHALVTIGKEVGKSILTDLIKQFIKSKIGIDL